MLESDTRERALRDRISHLEEEVRWLRDQLAPPGFLPAIFKLTDLEERAFKVLLSRDQWTREALLASIYLEASDRDLPDLKIIDVMICKMRKKLDPFRIDIETFWGKGYRISPAMRAHAARVIAAEHAKDLAAAKAVTARSEDYYETV